MLYVNCTVSLVVYSSSFFHINVMYVNLFVVQDHMFYLNYMFELTNGTHQVQHVYDMGPDLRGYAATMNEQ